MQEGLSSSLWFGERGNNFLEKYLLKDWGKKKKNTDSGRQHNLTLSPHQHSPLDVPGEQGVNPHLCLDQRFSWFIWKPLFLLKSLSAPLRPTHRKGQISQTQHLSGDLHLFICTSFLNPWTLASTFQFSPSAIGYGFLSSLAWPPQGHMTAPLMLWNKWEPPRQLSHSHLSSLRWWAAWLSQSSCAPKYKSQESPAWEKQLTIKYQDYRLPHLQISPDNLCFCSIKLFKYPIFSLNGLTCGSWHCLNHLL